MTPGGGVVPLRIRREDMLVCISIIHTVTLLIALEDFPVLTQSVRLTAAQGANKESKEYREQLEPILSSEMWQQYRREGQARDPPLNLTLVQGTHRDDTGIANLFGGQRERASVLKEVQANFLKDYEFKTDVLVMKSRWGAEGVRVVCIVRRLCRLYR